jgi:hypothetical protein
MRNIGSSNWQGFLVVYDGLACVVMGQVIIDELNEGISAIKINFELDTTR